MLNFLSYMFVMFSFVVSLLMSGVYFYVGFDIRKRFTGEPFEPGFNLTMKKIKKEYKIANDWWRNR